MVVFEDLNGDGYVTSEEDPEKGEVLERFMYYAFGMKWDGIWCPAEPLDPKEEHRYQYNGKEYSKSSGLSDYGFRYYLAEIGRFTGVDPIADQFPHVSVYNYAENRVPGGIDLWGLQYEPPPLPSLEDGAPPRFHERFNQFKPDQSQVQSVDGSASDKQSSPVIDENYYSENAIKSRYGLHTPKYRSLSVSFVFIGGGSFGVGKVSDKFGDKAWFSTIGGGVGLDLGIGFDAGGIVERDQDFRVTDFNGFGVDYGASLGPLGFRVGGNDINQRKLLYKGDTYSTVSGAASSGPPKVLNALKFKIGGSYLWNETTTH